MDPQVQFLSKDQEAAPLKEFIPPSKTIATRRVVRVMTPPTATPAVPVEGSNGQSAPVQSGNGTPPVAALSNDQKTDKDTGDKSPADTAQKEANQADKKDAPSEQNREKKPSEETPNPEDKNLAKSWATLMRKEREVQKSLAEMREYQKDQADYQKWKQEKSSFDPILRARDLINTDPDEALRLLGVKGGFSETSERMLDRLSKGESKPHADAMVERMAKRIEDLESKIESKERERTEREQREIVAQYVGYLGNFLTQNKVTYPLSHHHSAAQVLLDTMDEYKKQYGKLLSEKDAADMVEAHYRSEYKRALAIPEVRMGLELSENVSRETQPQKSPLPESSQGSKANDEPPHTLTNSQHGSAPMAEKGRLLTREEQIRALVARKYGQQ